MSNLRRYEDAPIKRKKTPLADTTHYTRPDTRKPEQPRVTERVWDPLPEPPRMERFPETPRRDPEDDLRAAKEQVKEKHAGFDVTPYLIFAAIYCGIIATIWTYAYDRGYHHWSII